jgi:hypothetical protein
MQGYMGAVDVAVSTGEAAGPMPADTKEANGDAEDVKDGGGRQSIARD